MLRGAPLLLALLALAGCHNGSRERVVRGDTGWTLRVPAGMHVERSGVAGSVSIAEVTVASFPPAKAVRTFSSPRESGWHVLPPLVHGRFPADGVALRIVHGEGGPAWIPLPSRETRLPVALRDFGPSEYVLPKRLRPRERDITGDGRFYQVFAWIGPKASADDRSQLERVVVSLAFPRVREGERLENGRVLGPASRYPVGSFTPVDRGYLVHAPGGFYSVGKGSPNGGYLSRCRLELARRQFLCANLDARWDRLGRVLEKPHGAKRGEPLWFSPADVTWDGDVLLFDISTAPVDRRSASRLWPRVVRGPSSSRIVVPGDLRLERHDDRRIDSGLKELTVASFPLSNGVYEWSKGRMSGMRVLSPRDPQGRFPAGGIALRILQAKIGLAGWLEGPRTETRLPLRLDDFAPSGFPPNQRPRALEQEVSADGDLYHVYAWTGPAASAPRRAELARVVSSFAVPRLHTGGDVLGRARDFPVGSITPLRRQDGAQYLVRSPGGFYALGPSEAYGFGSDCRLRVDRVRHELVCPALGARWDRAGGPRAHAHGNPLSFFPADVTWDGHVLLLGVGGDPDPAVVQRLWPRR